MDYHYKAFISYRHAELDTKIAVEIQNRIERYQIPGSIKKQFGIKSIGRVFRDKDELPSTSDLNDNIKNAIRSSEYLICICSPRYIESIWCRKEIEFFLESHDKHHVLTVLAEGEPYDVIPDILCSEMVTVKDEHGNNVTVETKLEPLSCDYRIGRRRARTEEFPRLAAVLIGCRYADLIQKMKKRRMRIMAAAATFAAALLAYFVWSYINIQNNYRKALINQSEYLASSARAALNDNDNVLAAQLSLAALPDGKTDRPVVPEAVYTLSRAVGAYQSKQIINFRGVASYAARTGTLSDYAVTGDAHYMAMITSGGDLEICDLAEDSGSYVISSYNLFGSAADRVASLDDDRFVLYGSYKDDVAVIRADDGQVLWHQQYSGSRKQILVAEGGEQTGLLLSTGTEILKLDPANGDIMNRISVSESSGHKADRIYDNAYGNVTGCFSLNEGEASCTALAVPADDTESVAGVLTYYYGTGKTVWTPVNISAYPVEGVSRDDKGRILIAYAGSSGEYCLNSRWMGSYASNNAFYENGKVRLLMIEEGSGRVLWENILSYTGLRETSYSCFDIRTMMGDEMNEDRDVVLAAVSNKIAFYDAADGTEIRQITLSDWVVSAEEQRPWENFARIHGASGTQYTVQYDSEDYSGMNFMEEQVDDIDFVHADEAYDRVSQFIVRQGSALRLFKGEQGDEDFVTFAFETPEDVSASWIFGTTLVLLDEGNVVHAYDMENEIKLFELELDSDLYYSFKGCSKDDRFLYLAGDEDNSHRILTRIDLKEGQKEPVDITASDSLTGKGKWKFDCFYSVTCGDFIFYRASNFDSMTSYWFRHSMSEGSTAVFALPYYEDIEYGSSTPKAVFSEDGSRGILLFDNTLYLADFEQGKVTAYESEVSGMTYASYREEDGTFAVYYQSQEEGAAVRELRVFDAYGKEKWAMENLPEKISAMEFHGEDLVVATDNKRLYSYSIKDGTRNGIIETGGNQYHTSWQLIDMDEQNLVIDSGSGNVLIIDSENWVLTGAATETEGYCPALKRIISGNTSGSGQKYGYCNYYSVEDLVEKGRAFVGSQTMSDADLAAYGLN